MLNVWIAEHTNQTRNATFVRSVRHVIGLIDCPQYAADTIAQLIDAIAGDISEGRTILLIGEQPAQFPKPRETPVAVHMTQRYQRVLEGRVYFVLGTKRGHLIDPLGGWTGQVVPRERFQSL